MATDGFDIAVDDFSRIVNAYVARTVTEDLDEIKNLGGQKGIMEKLRTDQHTGLSQKADDKADRKATFGVNKLPEVPPTPFWRLIIAAFEDFTLRILAVCGVVSLILGVAASEHPEIEWIEGFAIFVAVFVVVLVTAWNDWNKEKQFKKLNEIKEQKDCSVIRNEAKHKISVFDLVVGDIIALETGDEVPADCLVMRSYDVKVDESSLTGETEQIVKAPYDTCVEQIEQRQEKLNNTTGKKHHVVDSPVVLSGTTLTHGSGTFLVVSVGINSQVGRLMQLLQTAPEATPLQQKLEKIARDIGKAGLAAALLTLLALLLQYWIIYALAEPEDRDDASSIASEHVDFFVVAITVVVVAVPEGLPLAVTISLAYSISKMLADQNWVRRLAACETMGGANEVCSDKTGTLTKNRMTVQAFWNGSVLNEFENTQENRCDLKEPYMQILMDGLAVNSTGYLEIDNVAIMDGTGRTKEVINHVGSPTECALLQYMRMLDYDYSAIRKDYEDKIVHQEQFTSDRKMMTTVVRLPDGKLRIFTKGASERVLRLCSSRIDQAGNLHRLGMMEIERIEQAIIQKLASQALRTIAIAYRDIDENALPDWRDPDPNTGFFKMESDMTILGITGIRDPVRDEVPEAVRRCQRAGIKVRMVTGDNIETAKQIAIKCNIYRPENHGLAMLGKEFYAMVGGVICELCRTETCDCAREAKTAAAENKKIRNDVLGKPDEFARIAPRLEVLARSQPSDKYALVTGLKNLGAVVAVTGDGTNDAPALKKADVGFAMGLAGKEVAKAAADIVLLDDNFESIVKAVKWGRNIYDNIRRFLQFQITVNIVAVLTAFVNAIFIAESPLTAVQLLWINLIMDSFGSLALATEPPTDALLERRPHSRDEYLISKTMWRNIMGHALYQFTVISVFVYLGDQFLPERTYDGQYPGDGQFPLAEYNDFSPFSEYGDGESYVRSGRHMKLGWSDEKDYLKSWKMEGKIGPSRHYTMVFNVFVWMQVFNLLNARKIHNEWNIFDGIFRNRMFVYIWFLIVILQSVMAQFGSFVLSAHKDGLTWEQWLICIAFGAGELVVQVLLRLIPVKIMPQTGAQQVDPMEAPPSIAQMSRGRISSDRIADRLGSGFGSHGEHRRAHTIVASSFSRGGSDRALGAAVINIPQPSIPKSRP
ncbi:unnamed protein product [Vitrella brassicaformis CCMP3155]|uniref:Cation-transporting P-type ATPase N-terminal domain-containing protein n=2 Tax=Vitrella brassicaformis TaxID=1169539 RepID=A0A0G4GGR1_VITBC|nr:unnamed protein product [Vitrella brassicaformis CCMP3155]|mmetsp:Transcript_35948/g.89595  ORF Transcript_35948/g.89595 Transcript_35948/m.89595 type:complete len:1161 (+) Transcript_35948:307-3789(+)|eukprot:CEM28830.1 unnamed protein product [Vitrella brassicaformis CCMP3155]